MAIFTQPAIYINLKTRYFDDYLNKSSSNLKITRASMSSQYPLPASGINPSILYPCFNHHSSEFGKQLPSSITNHISQGNDKRPWTAMKTTIVSKPVSSLQGPTSADTNSLALSTEKKRNKLGYHRTSVACGHCRRRKIRCIATPGDRRCSNCIRLKKECNFYPVDQQPSGRREQKIHCTSERKSEDLLTSSKKNSQISEIPTSLAYPGNLSIPIIHDLGCSQTKHNHSASFSPIPGKVFRSEQDFNNSNSPVTSSNWMGSDSLHITDTSQDVSYWVSNTPKPQLPSNYSPFTPNLQASPLHDWTASPTDLNSAEEVPWSNTSRTVPFNNTQSSNNHHLFTSDSAYLQSSEHHTTKEVSSMSLCTSVNPVSSIGPTLASINDNPSQRQQASVLPISMSTWQQPYPHQKSTNRNLDQFGSWGENQSNSIIMKVESGEENLSPYIYDGFGTGVFYPPR